MRRTLFPALLLAAVLLLAGCAGQKAADPPQKEEALAATYKTETVTRADLADYKARQAQLSPAGNTLGDREALDTLLQNIVLLEEAQAQGLTPTQEEIEDYLQETLYASYALPEGKAAIDDYCASQGITYEEYEAALQAQAPRHLARAKLREQAARDYCAAHGLPWDPNNWPQEVQDGVAAYEETLWEAHFQDITYYIQEETMLDRFRGFPQATAALGLRQTDYDRQYFCTPAGARIIGWETGGIQYCQIDGLGDMVFAVNPMPLGDQYVYPLAETLEDFLRLLIAAQSVTPLEQIVTWSQQDYDDFLREMPVTPEAQAAARTLQREFGLTPMEAPYSYVKNLQAAFDPGRIPYTELYYNVTGQARPEG